MAELLKVCLLLDVRSLFVRRPRRRSSCRMTLESIMASTRSAGWLVAKRMSVTTEHNTDGDGVMLVLREHPPSGG